jgi:hypothetical protein
MHRLSTAPARAGAPIGAAGAVPWADGRFFSPFKDERARAAGDLRNERAAARITSCFKNRGAPAQRSSASDVNG